MRGKNYRGALVFECSFSESLGAALGNGDGVESYNLVFVSILILQSGHVGWLAIAALLQRVEEIEFLMNQ